MKKLFYSMAGVIALLVVILLIRTLTFTSTQKLVEKKVTTDIDAKQLAKHLSEAIQFRTVSAELNPQKIQLKSELSALKQESIKGDQPAHVQFEGFIQWLAKTYPEVHSRTQLQQLGKYSLLFKWQGAKPKLEPILLSAHYDVVPVITGSENLWTHPPYSGIVDQSYIWGRGALDDKSAVIALMEATSLLLAEGFQPDRSVYLSLTHDEEIGGIKGTKAIVDNLSRDDVHLAWTLDEGSFLFDGFFPGVAPPVANINLAEKGTMTIELVAHGQGGHSSMPPKETAVGILAQALVKLQAAPIPGTLDGLSGEMFDAIARHMPFSQRLLFANRWLFGDLIDASLASKPFSNAMLRTTTAPTMLSASIKENVLAIEAIGTINFRLHPRDSIEGVMNYVKLVLDDERIDVKLIGGSNASRVSSAKALGYKAIVRAAQSTYGNIVVAPGITIAATDSRRYEAIAENSYRFNPMSITPQDIPRFHGTNERMSIENMVNATRFYRLLIRNGSHE